MDRDAASWDDRSLPRSTPACARARFWRSGVSTSTSPSLLTRSRLRQPREAMMARIRGPSAFAALPLRRDETSRRSSLDFLASEGGWLGGRDSNPDKQNQRPSGRPRRFRKT